MVPSPKTLVFDSGQPTLAVTAADPSPVTAMVDRTHEHVLGPSTCHGGPPPPVPRHCGDLLRTPLADKSVKSVSMAVIRYEASIPTAP